MSTFVSPMDVRRTKIWPLALLFLLVQCEKNTYEPLPEDLGNAYFPLRAGTVWVYEVDSVAFNSFNPNRLRDTFHYLLRHELLAAFTLNEGDSLYPVQRSISADSGKSWQPLENWVMFRNAQNAQITAQGRKTVNMVFPVRLFKEWDGNLYNELDPEEYIYQSIDMRYRLNDSLDVPSVQVLQRDRENFVQRQYAEELYGKNIGLCQKKVIDLDRIYDSTQTNGFDYQMRLIKFYPAP